MDTNGETATTTNLEHGQQNFMDLKNYMEDDEASLLFNKTDLLKAFFDFLDEERSKLKKESPADLQSSLLIFLFCIATLVTLFTAFFFWRSKYGDLTLVELCAQRKQRSNNAAQEADPPPAYSRRASDGEQSPVDCPPSYTRARTLSEGDESCNWPTPLEVEQMAKEAEQAQDCSERLP